MSIKIKNRDPKSTDFSPNDIIVNVKDGTLFYKSDKALFKLQGDNLNTPTTENSFESSINITAFSGSFQYITASVIDVDAETIRFGGTSLARTDVQNLKTGLFNHITASGNISASGTGSFSDGRFTGNVGIGTTSPAAKLHTIPAGSIGWSSLGNAGILIGTDTGAGIGIDQNEIASKGDHLYLGTVTANKDLILRAGGTTNRLVVKGDTGNVGIGTSSPGNKLEVNSGTTNVAGVFKSSDNQAWISVQDDDSGTYGALFGTDSDEGHHIVLADRSANKRLVIDSSGNVGIGITTPTEKLQVTGNISASGTGSFGMINGGFF